jgi:hypothetical protein
VVASGNRRNGQSSRLVGSACRPVVEHVLSVERFAGAREPLSTCGGAAHAAIVQGQLEHVDDTFHLDAGGRWVTLGFCPKVPSLNVKRGQPTRKKLAADDALRKSVDGAKTELSRQFLDALSDQPLAARAESLKTISNQPINETTVGQTVLAARLARHFGIMADAGDFERRCVRQRQAHRNRQSCR